MLPIKDIDKSWTLFLDRDGVINNEKPKDYIHTWDEFTFYEGVKEAFEIFAKTFKRVIIITNQRGVGKGLTKESDLKIIHENMQLEVAKNNGYIDAVYYCTDLDDDSLNRKPNTGMGLQAIKDFPDIDPSRALMIGNTMSDMKFGKNMGMYTVFLPTTLPETDLESPLIDVSFPSLYAFALALA